MTLVEQAEALLNVQPLGEGGACIHCHEAPRVHGHAMDCPWWLPHDRIIKALKLAAKLAEAMA